MTDASQTLWEPPVDANPRIEDYMAWLSNEGGPTFTDYERLRDWSVTDLNAFWLSLWRYFEIPGDGEPTVALADDAMPGATWFPEVRVNYAEAMLRMPGRDDNDIVIMARSQSRPDVSLTAAELRDQVARARSGLIRAGVVRGDRVAAYAPNIPETLIVLLAAASLGAIFSSCAPEFGTQSVTDRWQQIEPKLVFAVDGYAYGSKPIDRRGEVSAILEDLPSVETLVWLPYLDDQATPPPGAPQSISWDEFVAQSAELAFDRLPFNAPLYVLFSSGTTGLPKAIIHAHGGITIEHLKTLGLHNDLGPESRFFWFSTTGWMMWNYLISGLAVGSTIVMFDGNPASPNLGMLWEMAGELGITYFGTSAPYLLQCRKAGIVPREIANLSGLRGIGSTGAPLPAEGFRWVYEAVSSEALLGSTSGGTDVCAAFVGAAPILPVYAGEIPCRLLGAAVESYDAHNQPVIGSLGELVITRPMPSMPVGFWGDDDGSRYRSAYFEDIPGVWRHGDWITINDNGSCVITGRSDATLNRGGVRLGTSEFYTVVEGLPEVLDSIVVHLEDNEGGAGTLLLFVVLADGLTLDDDIRRTISSALRARLSPRHVPDQIHQVGALPHTLSGKKLEVPIKKILLGASIEQAAAKGALTDPDALDVFVDFVAKN